MSECSGLDKVHQRSHLLWVAMQGMVWEYRTPGQVVLHYWYVNIKSLTDWGWVGTSSRWENSQIRPNLTNQTVQAVLNSLIHLNFVSIGLLYKILVEVERADWSYWQYRNKGPPQIWRSFIIEMLKVTGQNWRDWKLRPCVTQNNRYY